MHEHSTHLLYVIFFFQALFFVCYSENKIPPICSQSSQEADFVNIKISKEWKPTNSSLAHVCATPAVIDLDEDSFSDIIFIIATDPGTTSGTVFALSGNPEENLAPLWNYTNPTIPPFPLGNIAVTKSQNGNLICFPSLNTLSYVTCLNFSGDHQFSSPIPIDLTVEWSLHISIITFGPTETPIIIIGNSMFNSSGHKIWTNAGVNYKWTFIVSDLNNDSFPEVIYADKVLNPKDGLNVLFFNDGAYSNFDVNSPNQYGTNVGVADFDGDGYGDILKIGYTSISIWMHNGALLASFALPRDYRGSPLIRDINNDGDLDFGFPSSTGVFEMFTFNKFNKAIHKLWGTPIAPGSITYPASSVDLNGDEQYEVLYAPDTSFIIFSSNGTIIYKNDTIHHSVTWIEYPLYVDLENDGSGEIILINNYNNNTLSPIIILSATQKDNWTPTTSVWTDWGFTFHEGSEQGFVNPTFTPNWKLPWKDRNFFRGAINSCWICTGIPDPFFLSFNPECIAQQWTISENYTINSSSYISLSIDSDVYLKIENDFILANESFLNIIVSEKGDAGELNVDGSFFQNGNIIINMTNTYFELNQPIELKQIISFGNVNSSNIKWEQINVTTDPSIDPCFVEISQIPEQHSLSLSVMLSSKISKRCDSESSDNTGLIVGLTVGLFCGCVCILIIFGVIFLLVFISKKQQNKSGDSVQL